MYGCPQPRPHAANPQYVFHGIREKDDLINAGAIYEDAPVVVDRHFVSSRRPDDLPAFCKGLLEVLTDAVAADA